MSRRGLRERPAANRSPARILEPRTTGKTERPSQERCLAPHRRRQRPERGDPSPGAVLAGCQPLCVDARVAPGEATLAGEQERIGEVFERRAQLLDREQQFLRSHSSIAGLDRRDGLPVLEAEQTCHAVLGEFPLFARSALIRAPMSGGPTDDLPELIANSLMQELYATAMMPVARSVIRRAHGTRSAREDEPSLRDAWRLQKLLGQDLAGSRPRRRRAGRGHRHAAGFRAGRAAALRLGPLWRLPRTHLDHSETSHVTRATTAFILRTGGLSRHRFLGTEDGSAAGTWKNRMATFGPKRATG